MPRKKNTNFAGAPMVDVDVDALTFKRVIENAVGDTARAYDRMTGENGETNTMIHDGAGRGCLLGVPWCNQWVGRSLQLQQVVSGTGKHGGDGPTWLAAAPWYVPTNEDRAVIELLAESIGQTMQGALRAVQMLTNGTEVTSAVFVDVGDGILRAELTGLEYGTWTILGIHGETQNRGGAATLDSITVYTGRGRSGAAAMPSRTTADDYGVTDPGTAPIWNRDFSTVLFDAGNTINAFITAGLNRLQNGMMEYARNWPAGDDASYTHADSGSTNPSRSEFLAHTRAGFANEGIPPLPLMQNFYGACKADGYFVVDAAEPPTEGMLDWYAPWPKTSAALPVDIAKHHINVPDFPTTGGNLEVAVLAMAGPAFAGTWSITVDVGAATVTANFAAVGSTPFLFASATLPGTWTPDAGNDVNIGINRTAGARAVGEICILGDALAFDP